MLLWQLGPSPHTCTSRPPDVIHMMMLPGLPRSSPACIIVNANGGGLGTRQQPFSRQALLTVILVHKAEYYAGHQGDLAVVQTVYQALCPPPLHKSQGMRLHLFLSFSNVSEKVWPIMNRQVFFKCVYFSNLYAPFTSLVAQ